MPVADRLNVLIVDDLPESLYLLKIVLNRNFSCAVTQAENGAVAVSYAEMLDFDLIITDINMPVMDGVTAIREIRHIERNRSTPIIALTADTTNSNRTKSLEAGASEYMQKPVETKKLIETINRHLEGADKI